MVTSERLKEDILDHLEWDQRVDASEIEVKVDQGIVELAGKVPNYCARQAAERDARAVPGVTSVKNRLEVVYSTEVPCVSDEELRSRTENLLLWTPEIDASDIQVNVDNGAVELTGTVDASWKKSRAGDLTASLSGVRFVLNALAVVPAQNVADKVLAGEIMTALKDRRHLDLDRLDMEVRTGVVTFTGVVPDEAGYLAAYRAAATTPGVREIVNRLRIE